MKRGNQQSERATVEFRLRDRSRLATGWAKAVLFVTLMIGGLSAGLAVSTYTMTQANGLLSATFFNASESGSTGVEASEKNPAIRDLCQDTIRDYVL